MKYIPGYEGKYSATEDGRIYSHKTGKFLTPSFNTSRYFIVNLNGKTRLVSRMVALTFIGNPQGLPEVNHKNGIRTDNSIENLEWSSRLWNVRHSYRVLGRKQPFGSLHYKTKLTDKKVKEMRSLYAPKKFTYKMLASRFGVTESCVEAILRRRCWTHI